MCGGGGVDQRRNTQGALVGTERGGKGEGNEGLKQALGRQSGNVRKQQLPNLSNSH